MRRGNNCTLGSGGQRPSLVELARPAGALSCAVPPSPLVRSRVDITHAVSDYRVTWSCSPLHSAAPGKIHHRPPRVISFGNQALARKALHDSTRGTRVALFDRPSRNLRREGGEDMKLSSMIV